MPFPVFDRSRLRLRPLRERRHDMALEYVLPLDAAVPRLRSRALDTVADRILAARGKGRPVILMIGAHVIKQGCSRFIIDLVKRGLLTLVAMNGAGPIHDYELALVGASTESVARYIREGQFGLWEETGRINEAAREGVRDGIGLGEAIGRMIARERLPHREVSVLCACFEAQVPATVHIGVGYDIIHEHPNCDGAAVGATSYTDFLVFARAVEALEGGVLLNFGSAVMAPEVYLKALAMARNVAVQEGREIAHFTTAVFDLHRLGLRSKKEPQKTDPRYYYRPWKTMIVRTIQDQGESYYIGGDHRQTLPNLYNRLLERTAK